MNTIAKEEAVEIYTESPGTDVSGTTLGTFPQEQTSTPKEQVANTEDTDVAIYAEGQVINNTQQASLSQHEEQLAAQDATMQLKLDQQQEKKEAIEKNDTSGIDG